MQCTCSYSERSCTTKAHRFTKLWRNTYVCTADDVIFVQTNSQHRRTDQVKKLIVVDINPTSMVTSWEKNAQSIGDYLYTCIYFRPTGKVMKIRIISKFAYK